MKNRKKLLFFIVFCLINIAFIDIVGAETYNNYSSNFVSCGNNYVTKIPVILPKIVSIVYTIIQIAVPVLLVIFGMLDLMKGIASQKDDEIKKGQGMFVRRLIVGIVIFFVFVIVKFLIGIAADNSSARIIDCTECFISNKCDS